MDAEQGTQKATQPGQSKDDPILVADNVMRRFGGLVAVDVEHFEIQRGKITALIGPNGAGKTTFFNLLTGFDKPDTGTWTFNGESLLGRAAVQGCPPRHGAHLPAHQGALPPHGHREHAAGRDRPARREDLLQRLQIPVARPGAGQLRPRRRPAGTIHARHQARGLRRVAVRRPAQAAGDVPRPHGRPGADHARRADGRGEPGAQAVTAGSREVAARRGPHRAVRRARHGHGPRHLRLGGGDGPGQDRRRGPTRRRHGRSGRHRRLPRRAPRRRPDLRGRAEDPRRGRGRDRGPDARPEGQGSRHDDHRHRLPGGRHPASRQPGRRIPARRQHPQQRQRALPRRRARRHHRPERCRQVHPAQVAVRSGHRPRGHREAQGRGHHQPAGRPAGRSGHRVRAADQQRLPVAHRRREHGDGHLPGSRRSSPSASTTWPASSRGWPSDGPNEPGRCPAASARWSPWAAP